MRAIERRLQALERKIGDGLGMPIMVIVCPLDDPDDPATHGRRAAMLADIEHRRAQGEEIVAVMQFDARRRRDDGDGER